MSKIYDRLGVKDKNKFLVFSMYFISLVVGMISSILGTVLPYLQEDYNLTYSMGSFLLSANNFGNTLAILMAGILPFFIGKKKTVVSLFGGATIGILLITLTKNPTIIIIAFFITGLGRGTISNLSNVIVSENSKNLGFALNLLHGLFAFGAVLISIVFIFTNDIFKVSWKFSIIITFISAFVALLFVIKSNMSNEIEKIKSSKQNLNFLKSKSFWLIVLILFFYICVEASVMGWLVTYFKDSQLMKPSFASKSSFLLWIAMMIGRIFLAGISDKINSNKLILYLSIGVTLFFFLMIFNKNSTLVAISLIGLGFSMSGLFPVIMSTMKPEYAESSLAVGVCMGVATMGGIIMPIIVGKIADNTKSIEAGMATISGAVILMLVLIIINFFTSQKKILNKKNLS